MYNGTGKEKLGTVTQLQVYRLYVYIGVCVSCHFVSLYKSYDARRSD